ncbi:MAG: hypothetical protein ACE5GK_06075 [Nitrospiria bacterium]
MPEKPKVLLNLLKRIFPAFILGLVSLAMFPSSAKAIPAFGRKYDLSCTSCHTKPPRLNAFGEAFHMAGYQIPQTQEGELRGKRRIGRINSEIEMLNIFALRVTGHFAESISGGKPVESNLVLPREIEFYFAGTFTDNISYFFNLSHEEKAIEGLDDDGHGHGHFEEKSEFGLGKEFFLMFDLGPFLRKDVSDDGGKTMPMGPMIMGPMIMVGKIDPSTNFSYPTNRQFIIDSPGRVDQDSGQIQRLTLTPYAFASKFFGLNTGEGEAIEVTKEVLYNTAGDFGIDTHAMIGRFMFQAGIMQGIEAGTSDVNEKKDPYLMTRVNFGGAKYFSGSASALIHWGNDTARVGKDLIDWVRYGFAGNVKYKLLDLYGAVIWDQISGLPTATAGTFDDTAFGLTIEGDFIMTDRRLISLRYDQMEAGGFRSRKAGGKVLTLQLRNYIRDNFALFLRDSVNVGRVSDNPLQNFRNLIALGIDFDF